MLLPSRVEESGSAKLETVIEVMKALQKTLKEQNRRLRGKGAALVPIGSKEQFFLMLLLEELKRFGVAPDMGSGGWKIPARNLGALDKWISKHLDYLRGREREIGPRKRRPRRIELVMRDEVRVVASNDPDAESLNADEMLISIMSMQVELEEQRRFVERGKDVMITVDNVAKTELVALAENSRRFDIEPMGDGSQRLIPNEHVGEFGQWLKQQAGIVSSPVSESLLRKNPGGIDFNAGHLNMSASRQGSSIRFTDLPNIPPGSVNGLTPVIINITPLTNFPLLLGFNNANRKGSLPLSRQ